MNTFLVHALEANHLPHDAPFVGKLLHYLELLQNWNRVFNLTAITQFEDMVYLHLIDSLLIHPHLQGSRMLDIGSGAGFPGIPLALLHPAQHWTLLDKNSKKTRFLTQACAELELSHVTVAHHRCEDFHPSHCFDTIVTRAFGSADFFIRSTQHLICPEGLWMAMKGKRAEAEAEEVPEGIQKRILRLEMRGRNLERHLLLFTRHHRGKI